MTEGEEGPLRPRDRVMTNEVNTTPDPDEYEEEVIAVITPTNSDTGDSAGHDESVSAKAHEAGESIKDLLRATAKKTEHLTKHGTDTVKNLANPKELTAKIDAKDIGRLGPRLERLTALFEDTMAAISKRPYYEQVELLSGYSRLIQGQISVINSRIEWAKRLKKE